MGNPACGVRYHATLAVRTLLGMREAKPSSQRLCHGCNKPNTDVKPLYETRNGYFLDNDLDTSLGA